MTTAAVNQHERITFHSKVQIETSLLRRGFCMLAMITIGIKIHFTTLYMANLETRAE